MERWIYTLLWYFYFRHSYRHIKYSTEIPLLYVPQTWKPKFFWERTIFDPDSWKGETVGGIDSYF